MSGIERKLSTPLRIAATPRPLTESEWATLVSVADTLIPSFQDSPHASAAPQYDQWLMRALAARAEHFDVIVGALEVLGEPRDQEFKSRLEAMSLTDTDSFQLLSTIVAGAYLMVPEVRAQIGYPGQGGAAPRLEEAAEQLEDGILDPVINRGPRYVSAADE